MLRNHFHELGTVAWKFALAEHAPDDSYSFVEGLYVTLLDTLFHFEVKSGSDAAYILEATAFHARA